MFSSEFEFISVCANPKGGNQALSIRSRGQCVFHVFLTSNEKRCFANAMFSIEFELISFVSNPKGENQVLSIRSRGRRILNVFLTSNEKLVSNTMLYFQLHSSLSLLRRTRRGKIKHSLSESGCDAI